MGGYAWVTLATNDSYSLGALVLAHSLKKAKTAHKLVVLITPAVSQPMREQLQTVFDVVKVVDVLDSKDEAHLALMQRPELGITFTKIHCWRMTEFDKCVFLDADTLVVRNCDELFEREEFSAAPDVSWPDCFNSGVFVYKPSVETFNKLLQFAVEKGSFDGGDQGLLNQFFSDWATEDIKKHLPFVYNLTSVAAYSYIPAFKHYGAETRIVHFIGTGKPWLQQLDPATRTITPTAGSEHLTPLLQQWWDLFCEKVHPALDKNLESNNDGMSHPPVEACSNILPIALTDDSQTPRLIEPCTPYREKDDFRQYNLPYQPFDVRGSSGELLNVEFLLASVVQPEETQTEEQQRQTNKEVNERCGNEDVIEKVEERKEHDDSNEKKTESGREIERMKINVNPNEHFRLEKSDTEYKKAEEQPCKEKREQLQNEPHIQQVPQQELQQESEQPVQSQVPEQSEQPPPPTDPFDYNSFFPDENCVNNYLEQNVVTYQPYDNQHHQPNKISDSTENSCENLQEANSEIISNNNSKPQESSPPLPRFLTIPENDQRQSGNMETPPQIKEPEPQRNSPVETVHAEELQCEQAQQVEDFEEKRELTKAKSMPYLQFDVTEVPPLRSMWKSQPDVNVESNKKYSMPKLKPILPRQNSLSKSVPSVIPKVTLYTEFLMSADYKDPADLPNDKVGFIETLLRRGQLRRSKSAADITHRFGPLPYESPEAEQPAVLQKTPLSHLDNELYDLSQCKRQIGNKPKAKPEKENSHSLPALKPLVPPKDKKSTLIKKRKSKELSPGESGREKMLKREPKKPKDRKRPKDAKIIPRNVSETANGNNVDEILKKLRDFSKNYQHFFNEVPEYNIKTKNKNVTMQTNDGTETQNETKTSEEFLKTSAPTPVTLSKVTPTSEKEEKSERQSFPVDLGFRNFRTYIQEKSKKSQKGLLSIQDLVSKPENKIAENVKVPSNRPEHRSELKKTAEKVSKRKTDTRLGKNKEAENERKSLGKRENHENVSVDDGNFSKGTETAKIFQTNRLGTPILSNDNSIVEKSNKRIESVPNPKSEAGRIESSANELKLPEKVSNEDTKASENISESASFPAVDGEKVPTPSPLEKELKTTAPPKENAEHENTEEHKVKEDTKSKSSEKFVSPDDVPKAEPSDNFDREIPGIRDIIEDRIKVSKSDCDHLIPTGERLKEKPFTDKLRAEKTAAVALKTNIESSPPKSLVQENRVCEKNGNSREKVSENGNVGIQSKTMILHCRKEERQENAKKIELIQKLQKPDEILCVPDFDTPRSSRVTLPASEAAAAEVLEEIITKATPHKSQTSTPPRTTNHHKHRKNARKVPAGTRTLPNGNSSPRSSPDGPSLSPASLSSPPYATPNGSAMHQSQEELVSRSGIAGAIAQLSLEADSGRSLESATAASTAHQEYLRRQNWETGNVDYMGRDSFDNIWSKIRQTLEGKELEEEATPTTAAVSPKLVTESSNFSSAIPKEDAGKSEKPATVEPSVPTPGPVTPPSVPSVPTPAPVTPPSVPSVPTPAPVTPPSVPSVPTPAPVTPPSVPSVPTPAPVTPPSVPSVPTPAPVTPASIPSETSSAIPSAAPTVTSSPSSAVTPPALSSPATSSTPSETPSALPPVMPPIITSAVPTNSPSNAVIPSVTSPSMPAASTPTDIQKCPEYIETLAGDPVAGPVEDDEIIFSKIDNKQSCLTNISEEEELGTEGSAKAGKVKLSDILHPKESTQGETGAKSGEQSSVAVAAGEKAVDEAKSLSAESDKKQPEPLKVECKTVAISQPSPSAPSPQAPGTENKTEGCTTVAIPSPPIVIPGAPFSDKGKGERTTEKSEPIPLPPPETPLKTVPEIAPLALQEDTTAIEGSKADSSKEEGKQKKGVISKILEIVGVAPKEKHETEISKSVFYDEGGAVSSKQESVSSASATAESKKEVPITETKKETQVPSTQIETKEVSTEPKDVAQKAEGVEVAHEEKKTEDKVASVLPIRSEDTKELSLQEMKQRSAEAAPVPSEAKEIEKSIEQKSSPATEPEKSAKMNGKGKQPKEKPERNASPKKQIQPPIDAIHSPPPKSKSPSPKLTLPQTPPVTTAVTTPTPPPQTELPPRKNSALLKVEETIPETPPVPQPPKEDIEGAPKGKVLAEVVDIIDKAKSEVESRLQEGLSAEKESAENVELINAMKLIMGDDGASQQPTTPEVEELRVTTEEDRQRHKGETPSSKLSDQILKAIPPPRRKAISESSASASASAIPSPPPSPAPAPATAPAPPPASDPGPAPGPAPQQKNPKGQKSSSIPVPPPRSRGKPQQTTPTTPTKGKQKK